MQPVDPITAGLNFGGMLIDRIWPDKTEAEVAKINLAEMAMNGELQRFMQSSKLSIAELKSDTELAKAQAEINAIEAGSDDFFRGGWRPAIGWVCGSAFAWHFVLGPIVAYISALFGHVVPLPSFEMDALMTILIGMLGLGGMRTAERIAGKIPQGR